MRENPRAEGAPQRTWGEVTVLFGSGVGLGEVSCAPVSLGFAGGLWGEVGAMRAEGITTCDGSDGARADR